MRSLRTVVVALVLALALGGSVVARAQAPVPRDDASIASGRTPPRLSYADGQVSFWRPGAPDWVTAQVNTPLAPGDELSTGSPGTLELQVGARALVRAWADTSLGLMNQNPDFLQIKVTAGHVSLDLRSLDSGRTVELDTPNAAFTIHQAGYYRVDVTGDRTSFITRRGGRATVTPANGQTAAIAPGEVAIIEGTDTPRIATYVAPQVDEWDRWNYARSDYTFEAVSARYVSPDVYGVSDLDRYGRWRVVSDYGPVWVPTAVSAGWVPYSTGSWTWDPYYGWTWVDVEPWGWAPFHYGRWVFVDGFWGWTPGSVVVRPAYAPALVAFFGAGPGLAIRVGPPVVGWVALGWGEPVIPWWGGSRFVGVPSWGGWGGPRVVNNVVINRTTVVNVQNITVYRNTTVQNAVVAVEHQRFGHGPVASSRVAHVDVRGLEPIRGHLDVKPVPVSLAPTTTRGVRPSDERLARPVVATRAPHPTSIVPASEEGRPASVAGAVPPPRLVPAPGGADAAVVSPRPPFGQGRSERPQPPSPPHLKGVQPAGASVTAPGTPPSRPGASRGLNTVGAPPPTPQTPAPRIESRPPRPVSADGVLAAPPAAVRPAPVSREPRTVSPALPVIHQMPAAPVPPLHFNGAQPPGTGVTAPATLQPRAPANRQASGAGAAPPTLPPPVPRAEPRAARPATADGVRATPPAAVRKSSAKVRTDTCTVRSAALKLSSVSVVCSGCSARTPVAHRAPSVRTTTASAPLPSELRRAPRPRILRPHAAGAGSPPGGGGPG